MRSVGSRFYSGLLLVPFGNVRLGRPSYVLGSSQLGGSPENQDRAAVVDPQQWDVTLASRPFLSRPSLPALRSALCPSMISDISFAVREWFKDVLDMGGLLSDLRWLEYV